MPPKSDKKPSIRRQINADEESLRNLLGNSQEQSLRNLLGNSQEQSVTLPESNTNSREIQLLKAKISELAVKLIHIEEILLAFFPIFGRIDEAVGGVQTNLEEQTAFLKDFRTEVKKEFENLIEKIRLVRCNFSSWEQFWNCIGIVLTAIWDFLKFIGLCMYVVHGHGVSFAGDMAMLGLPPLLFKTLFCIFEVLAYCSFIGAICLKLGLPNYGLKFLKFSIELIIFSVICFFKCLIVIFKSLFGDAWDILIDSLRTAGLFSQFKILYEYATGGVKNLVHQEAALALKAITPAMPAQLVPNVVLDFMGFNKGGDPSLRRIPSVLEIDTYLQKSKNTSKESDKKVNFAKSIKTSKESDKKVNFAKFMNECKVKYESSELFKEINAAQKEMMSVLDMCKELKIDSEIPSALNATVCKDTLIGILEGVEKMADFGFCFQIGLLNIRRPVDKSEFDSAVKKTDIEQVSFSNFLKMDKGSSLSDKIDTIRLQLKEEKIQLKDVSNPSKSKSKHKTEGTEGGRKKKNSTRKKVM